MHWMSHMDYHITEMAEDIAPDPLYHASWFGLSRVVEDLLRMGTDPNIEDTIIRGYYWSPLEAAVASGNAEVVKLLLEAGADVEPDEDSGRSILHLAAE